MAKKTTKPTSSKNKPQLVETVMAKIEKQELKMLPKIYFWLGSVLLGIGSVGVFVMTTMFASIWVFQMRAQHLFGPEALELLRKPALISRLPWIPLLTTTLSFVIGLALIKKYDFAYKKNWWVIVIGILMGVVLMTGLVESSGLNDYLSRDKRMQRFYQHHIDEFDGYNDRGSYEFDGEKPQLNPRVKGRMIKSPGSYLTK